MHRLRDDVDCSCFNADGRPHALAICPTAYEAPARGAATAWFAPDSPLEEAVTSEPVSVENSLLAANLQGISLDSATLGHFRARKRMRIQALTEPIPYASEQGIFTT